MQEARHLRDQADLASARTSLEHVRQGAGAPDVARSWLEGARLALLEADTAAFDQALERAGTALEEWRGAEPGARAIAECDFLMLSLRVEWAVHAGSFRTGEPLARRLREQLGAVNDAAERARALASIAMIAEGVNHREEASAAISRSLEEAAYTRGGDRRVECFVWRAGHSMAQGAWTAVRSDVDATVISLRAGVSPLTAAWVRVRLVSYLVRLGSLDEAAEHVEEARAVAARVPRLAAGLSLAAGELAFARGDFERATVELEKARHLAESDASLGRLHVAALLFLGDLAAAMGDGARADATYARVQELTEDEAPREHLYAILRRAALAVDFREMEEPVRLLAGALGRARELGDRQAQAIALGVSGDVEVRRGRLLAAASTLREGAALAEGFADHSMQAELLRRHAEVVLEMGEPKTARLSLERALQAAARCGLGHLQAHIQLAIGHFHEQRGDYNTALAGYRQALRAARGQGNPLVRLSIWMAIGTLMRERLRQDGRGHRILQLVRERAEARGLPQLAAEARLRVAASRAAQGDVDVAYDLLGENLLFYGSIGDNRRHAETLLRLADLFVGTLAHVEKGQEIFRELGLVLEDAADTIHLARSHGEFGRRCSQVLEMAPDERVYEVARNHLEQALSLFATYELYLPHVDTLLDLAELHLVRRQVGDVEHARRYLERARKLAAESNYAPGLARFEATRARLAAASELFREALQHFDIARERYEALGDLAGVFRVERARGEIQLVSGERNRAELSLKRALAVAEQMGSMWDQRATYHALHGLKAQLGDRPAAAQLEAKSRALEDVGTTRRFAESKLRLYRRLEIRERVQQAMVDLIAVNLDTAGTDDGALVLGVDGREEAAKAIVELEEMCREDPASQAICYRQLGDLFVDRGDVAEADSWYFRAMEAVRASAGIVQAVGLTEAIVETFDEVQDRGAVDRWVERGIELAESEGRDQFAVQLYNRFGGYYRSRGRYEEALELLREGHQCAREIGDPGGELDIATALGELHRELTDHHDAIAWFEIADRVAEKHGDPVRRRDLALAIAGCHALAAALGEDDKLPGSEVDVLRRQAKSWLKVAEERADGARRLADEAGELMDAIPGGRELRTEDEAQVASLMGEINLDLRDEEEGRKYFEAGARLLERGGFPGRQGDYMAMIGDRFREHERWGTAASWYRRAFSAYLSAGEPERALEVAGDIGAVYLDAGDPEMAVEFCQEATRRLGADVDADILGRLTHLRARLERRARDAETSLRSLREAVGYLHAAGDLDRVIGVYDDIADVLLQEGERDQAVDSYRELLELISGKDDPRMVATIHGRIGSIYRATADFEPAVQWLEDALSTLRESGNDYDIAGALEDLAQAHLDADEHERALELFTEALQIYHRLEDLPEIAWANLWCCDVFLRTGDVDAARRRAKRAEGLFKSQRQTPAQIEAAIWLAQCDQAEGNHDAALETLEYALGRTKALPRDEDKLRPARFLHDMFEDMGHTDLAEDCARILESLGEMPPPGRGDDEDFPEDDDGDRFIY